MGFGSYIFEFFGVLFLWIVNIIYSNFTGRKSKTFSEIWDGKKNYSSADLLLYSFVNIVLGFVICMIIISFLS
jgi:hypothetical protein